MIAATAAKPAAFQTIQRPIPGASIFDVTGPSAVAIRAGTWIGELHIGSAMPVALADPVIGADYAVRIVDGLAVAGTCLDGVPEDAVGGFHFAPGGNAPARAGGDEAPAINPASCWDIGFRPACTNPRGMALVRQDDLTFWCDIYLLGTDHLTRGTSRFGATIADGVDRPAAVDGKGKAARCDFLTVQAIYAHHGKQLLTYDEFRAGAFGVTEKSAAERDPRTTGLDAARTSRAGVMQATGNMWVWGTDGDPDDPRPSIFGGSWLNRSGAGSRCASLDGWPADSSVGFSARGRSDHLAA